MAEFNTIINDSISITEDIDTSISDININVSDSVSIQEGVSETNIYNINVSSINRKTVRIF